MQASVVISYYKNIANLEILLLALKNQSSKNTFEVIISEDDDAIETKNSHHPTPKHKQFKTEFFPITFP